MFQLHYSVDLSKLNDDDDKLVNGSGTFGDAQDDVVMGTLTVRENLMFSANLRLPQSMSSDEKADRVDEAIEELGLDKCADTKVGMKLTR